MYGVTSYSLSILMVRYMCHTKKNELIMKCNVPIYTLWTDLMFYKEKKMKTLSKYLFNDIFKFM